MGQTGRSWIGHRKSVTGKQRTASDAMFCRSELVCRFVDEGVPIVEISIRRQACRHSGRDSPYGEQSKDNSRTEIEMLICGDTKQNRSRTQTVSLNEQTRTNSASPVVFGSVLLKLSK